MAGADRIGRLVQSLMVDGRSPRSDGRPRQGVAVVTCMDARVDPEGILGFDPGDAHVIRNAGGAITDDVVQSIVISQRDLGTRAVIVLHHTGCTGMRARCPGVRAEVALHDAVEALRGDDRLIHRGWVSGTLWDTVGRVLLEGGRPGGVDDHPHAPAPARTSVPVGTHGPAAESTHRCEWCGRPFGGVGDGRRRGRRRYCGDLCRIAARGGSPSRR